MEKHRNIVSFFLLSIYLLVLLHNVVPHFHVDGMQATLANHHHSHEDSHQHNHQQDHNKEHSTSGQHADDEILHSFGHLLGDLPHASEEEAHLVHVATDSQVGNVQLKVAVAILLSYVLPPIETGQVQKLPESPVPPFERLLSTALPLRAPPALS